MVMALFINSERMYLHTFTSNTGYIIPPCLKHHNEHKSDWETGRTVALGAAKQTVPELTEYLNP